MNSLQSGISHGRDDGEGGDPLKCCDSQSAGASEVVAVGVCRSLEQAEHAQAAKLSRQLAGRHGGQKAGKVGSGQAMDIEFGTLHSAQQRLVVGVEEVQALEGTVAVGHGVGDTFKRALAAAVVVQAGQELEVALVAAEQYLAQVDEAVDGLLQRCDLAGDASIAMFHLAV